MKSRLLLRDGWQLLLPFTIQLAARVELLPNLGTWLSPLSHDEGPLATVLPFVLLLGLSHVSVAHQGPSGSVGSGGEADAACSSDDAAARPAKRACTLSARSTLVVELYITGCA